MIREISYGEVKNSLKTGDLVLFHGVQPVSKLIELVEWSYWSHIGVVVLPKDIGLAGEEPLFWESTSSGDGIVDALIGKPKENGPMLVPLGERIRVDLEGQYDTHFKVKYLSRSLTPEELQQVKDFIYLAHSRTFPATENLFKYYIEGKFSNIPAPDTCAFCSELTAETFMAIGLLSRKYVPNGYCPNDFDQGDNLPSLQPFFFINGARLNQ